MLPHLLLLGKEGLERRVGREFEDGYWCQAFVIWKSTGFIFVNLTEMITSLPINCLAITVNYAQTEHVFTVVTMF